MNIDEIKELVKTKDYDFLRTNEHLKGRIILLGLGGSYMHMEQIQKHLTLIYVDVH